MPQALLMVPMAGNVQASSDAIEIIDYHADTIEVKSLGAFSNVLAVSSDD